MADTPARRSAAAQFFTEEGDADAGPSATSVYDKVCVLYSFLQKVLKALVFFYLL